MRVLITSVPAGSGHLKAAEALLETFQRGAPGVTAEHLQVTDLVSSGFRRLYVEGYRVTINRAPSLWGRMYRFWDRQPPEGVLTPLLHRAQRALSTGFYAYLARFKPDLILSTHFLIPQLIAADRAALTVAPRVETVLTDYDAHRFWVSPVVSHYYVAHEDLIPDLVRLGVPARHVTASGIPVHPRFSDSVSPSQIFARYALDIHRPVVLVLAGGLGMNTLAQAVEALFALPGDVQIITVSGRNEALRQSLDRLALSSPPGVRLINLGYVDNMHELLSISQVVVTKPGGLTVSECLVKRKPMVLFGAIPGQEEKNAAFLTRHGAAVQAASARELPGLTARILNDRFARRDMLAALQHTARPYAAGTIAQHILRGTALAA